jgi:hypothetical protein
VQFVTTEFQRLTCRATQRVWLMLLRSFLRYLTAEWIWLAREKDHRAIAAPAVGLMPSTPFSTLVMWPLTGLAPLAAKHVWILANLALLVPLCWILRSMTGLTYRRIALVFALSFPLHRNLLYGQFYIFLLFLIAAACWGYLRGKYALAGALVGIAGACKIFPILFLVFFVQRRAWRALIRFRGTIRRYAMPCFLGSRRSRLRRRSYSSAGKTARESGSCRSVRRFS